jgi:iron(III) transport system substrate-binding protein
MSLKPLALLAALALPGAAFAQPVTVYTAGPANLIENLAAGFEAATGTRVDIFQATTGQVMARLEAEAASPVADIVISASLDTALDFDSRGMLQPHGAANAATVPDFLKDANWVTQGVAALVIAWNPTSGTPRPNDWADLAGPAFKDLVTMPDPASSGSAYELVAALTGAADLGWGLFEKLGENGMIVPGANAQAMNPVLQGAKAAVFGAVDYIAYNQAAAGESLEVIIPESGTVIAPRPMMILSTAPNPEGARAFIDYVLSDEGQAMVAAVSLMPARADVPADRPLIADLKVIAPAAGIDRAATLARFTTAVGKP